MLKELYDTKEETKISKYKTMLSFCLKSRKSRESKNPRDVRTKNERIMLHQNVQCVIVKGQNL